MRIESPTGLCASNSSLRTVAPMMHTALPARSSVALNSLPSASVQLPAVK